MFSSRQSAGDGNGAEWAAVASKIPMMMKRFPVARTSAQPNRREFSFINVALISPGHRETIIPNRLPEDKPTLVRTAKRRRSLMYLRCPIPKVLGQGSVVLRNLATIGSTLGRDSVLLLLGEVQGQTDPVNAVYPLPGWLRQPAVVHRHVRADHPKCAQ